MLRIWRVKIDPRWPEGGMQKEEVIILRALSSGSSIPHSRSDVLEGGAKNKLVS